MENSATLIWNGKNIGTVHNISSDMWYLDAEWISNKSDDAYKFEEKVSTLVPDEILKEFSKGIVASLNYNSFTINENFVLILSLNKSKLLMRLINDETAAFVDLNLMQPWQQINNAPFYEKELKSKLSLYHPLKWKKIKAIGHRSDNNEILFEISKNSYKYAVVNLTYKKEGSKLFANIHSYKDWRDLYQNRLIKDHNEWTGD